MNYVLGFMFQQDKVLLIEKKKPAWQEGSLNGIGGKIEEGEGGEVGAKIAMAREFKEETGIVTEPDDWKNVAILSGADWTVIVFTARGDISEAESITDEEVGIYDSNFLPDEVLGNLYWLIPLCKEEEIEMPVQVFYKSATT